MKRSTTILTILIALLFFTTNSFAEKYAGEIFDMGIGVRNLAIGNLGITDTDTKSKAYWNASLLGNSSGIETEVMHSEEFNGLLSYDTASLTWGKTNRYNLILSRINISDIGLTKLENPDEEISDENRPYIYKNISNSDYIIYFGFMKKIKKLPVGITTKLIYRNRAGKSGYGFGADLTTHYYLNQKILLGARLHDFFSTQIFWESGNHEIINPGLDLESRFQFLIPLIERKSFFYLNFETLFEGREEAANLSFSEISTEIHTGLELNLHKYLDLYLGYDYKHFTSGLSLNLYNFDLNYSFETHSSLDNSHRISVGYKFNN